MCERVIKFRAWDREAKGMVDFSSYARWGFVTDDSNLVQGGDMLLLNPRRFKFMQLTGHRDSKLNDLYEGDIVRSSTLKDGTPLLWKVVFHKGYFTLRSIYSGKLSATPVAQYFWHFVEKVGNEFENPELLLHVRKT